MARDNRSVLMLEEEFDDRFETELIIKELNFNVPISFVSTSEELFKKLNAEKNTAIIILDYNAIPENAVQIMRRLKAEEAYRKIPVIILIDSINDAYITECYEEGAASVIFKPSSEQATKNKIKIFFTYWLKVVEL